MSAYLIGLCVAAIYAAAVLLVLRAGWRSVWVPEPAIRSHRR